MNQPLSIQPTHLIVPPELEDTAWMIKIASHWKWRWMGLRWTLLKWVCGTTYYGAENRSKS